VEDQTFVEATGVVSTARIEHRCPSTFSLEGGLD
jgi:hypothetical protein